MLLRCLSHFRAIRSLWHPISRLRDFTRSHGKTSVHLMNRGPASEHTRTQILTKPYLPVLINCRDISHCGYNIFVGAEGALSVKRWGSFLEIQFRKISFTCWFPITGKMVFILKRSLAPTLYLYCISVWNQYLFIAITWIPPKLLSTRYIMQCSSVTLRCFAQNFRMISEGK